MKILNQSDLKVSIEKNLRFIIIERKKYRKDLIRYIVNNFNTSI